MNVSSSTMVLLITFFFADVGGRVKFLLFPLCPSIELQRKRKIEMPNGNMDEYPFRLFLCYLDRLWIIFAPPPLHHKTP